MWSLAFALFTPSCASGDVGGLVPEWNGSGLSRVGTGLEPVGLVCPSGLFSQRLNWVGKVSLMPFGRQKPQWLCTHSWRWRLAVVPAVKCPPALSCVSVSGACGPGLQPWLRQSAAWLNTLESVIMASKTPSISVWEGSGLRLAATGPYRHLYDHGWPWEFRLAPLCLKD